MNWVQIRALAESKSFWSLNILLVLVPLMAKFGFSIAIDTVFLYVSAILVTISTLGYLVCKPEIIVFNGCSQYVQLGKLPVHLLQELKNCGIQLDEITDKQVKCLLEDKTSASEIDNKSFWYVHNEANTSRKIARTAITTLYSLAFIILIGVNGYRFTEVLEKVSMNSTTCHKTASPATPNERLPSIRVGNESEVEHSDGKGGIKKTNGKLLNPDDNGYVVIEESSGTIKYIPKDKVIEISQLKDDQHEI